MNEIEQTINYQPEFNLLKDAYLGPKEVSEGKLQFLVKMAQHEQWDYKGESQKRILYNYLCYTYDRIKQENKFAYSSDDLYMCFNTGLLTENGADIYAYFTRNNSKWARPDQRWYLFGFKQRTDAEMRHFKDYLEIADYFTNPSNNIFDKSKKIDVDYDHIIDDNYDRFVEIGLVDIYVIRGLLVNAVMRITKTPKEPQDKKTQDKKNQDKKTQDKKTTQF